MKTTTNKLGQQIGYSLKEAYHAWRNPDNFDALGKEIRKLSDFTKYALTSSLQKQPIPC